MRKIAIIATGIIGLLTAGCATTPSRPALDLKIVKGRVVDGTGSPWYRADVGVRGDTIVAIGDLSAARSTTPIDAHDQVVSPGFIDLLGQSQGSAMIDPHLEGKIRQGVTTEVTGEGHSPGPVGPGSSDEDTTTLNPKWRTLGEYFSVLEKNRSAINFAFFVGASNPREMVIGNANRPPTAAELQRMEAIVDQAMREGAIGLSTSLIYLPAMFSTTEEIIALARVAARYGGVYFSHMRSEGDDIDSALEETFRIGREAKIPVNIWHLKTGGRANWGRMPEVIARIQAARDSGLDVAANVYPYVASSTSLSTLLPDWALEGGYSTIHDRFQDPAQRTRIVEALRAQVAKRGEHGIYVSRIGSPAQKPYEKMFLEQIAAGMGIDPAEALVRLYDENKTSPGVIFFSMNEDDVKYALRTPWVSVGADSGSVTPAARAAGAGAHPRAYGTFPRVAGHYVRDEKLFTLEEAVRKMTSQAADRAHLLDRGILRPGMKADIIVFDPLAIRDVATYEDVHHFSLGVRDVVVNGMPVLYGGEMTAALPGRVLRGAGYRSGK
jgi:N-acyl-D-amino-acid deacylase